MMIERDEGLADQIKVSSAGFIPQKLKDQLTEMHISSPNPFYDRPMAEITRFSLLKKGLAVPEEWRSKELNPKMVEDTELIITALSEQKEELINLFPKAQAKIFTMREMSKWDGYLFFEDFKIVPMDDTFWDYVEGDPDYVSKVISLTEETLIRAFPIILKKLGIKEHKGFEK
jgi:protein-tyrosine-phosphatase